MANIQSIITNGNGNVLIGTTTDAGYKLDVNGTGRFSNTVYVNKGGRVLSLGVDFANHINWDSNVDLALNISNGGTGNVAFFGGGATAVSTLYANGGALFTNSVIVNNATNDGVGALQVKVLAANQSAVRIASTTNNNLFNFISNDTPGNAILDLGKFTESGTYAAGFIRLRTDGDSWIQGGNVGIGTTSPATKLEIIDAALDYTSALFNSQIITTPAQSIDRGGSLAFGGQTGGGGATQFGAIRAGKENSTFAQTGGYLSFMTRADASPITDKMRITSGGNVLIGTATDTGFKLNVNGNTYSITVTTSLQGINVSDYGFLTQTISGQMTLLGHNVRASSSVANEAVVVNAGWISSLIKMYYSD